MQRHCATDRLSASAAVGRMLTNERTNKHDGSNKFTDCAVQFGVIRSDVTTQRCHQAYSLQHSERYFLLKSL